MKAKHLLALLPVPLLFASCGNPADETESALVTDAVEVAESDAAVVEDAITYTLLPESEIQFIGSKVTGRHDGGFKTFTGSFTVADGQLVGSGHQVVIDMNSVWSDNENLTSHLKNEDFFDVEKHPTATFTLTGLEAAGEEGKYSVSGNFTLIGNTRNLTFPATASVDGETVSIHAKFDINRKDWGVVYAGRADDLIRDEVVIELKLVAAPEAAPEA
ncbi:MAG: YceI family protein [Luteolibacter sp.]|jgi:polyisoprenoid-binding protein YceI